MGLKLLKSFLKKMVFVRIRLAGTGDLFEVYQINRSDENLSQYPQN